jgi:hypothetical protein
MSWNAERIEELMTMYANGYTSYEMAAHFKTTRNAICGKIYREKVRRGDVIPAPRKRRKASPADKQRKRDKLMLTLPVRAESVSRYVAPKVAAPDLGRLASIVDVMGCRWPVRDDPEFIGGIACCNHETDAGASYCPYHAEQSKASYSQSLIKKTIKQALYKVEIAPVAENARGYFSPLVARITWAARTRKDAA